MLIVYLCLSQHISTFVIYIRRGGGKINLLTFALDFKLEFLFFQQSFHSR